jgi:hypothetical protein
VVRLGSLDPTILRVWKAKRARVVLRVEGSYFTIKGGFLQIRGGSDDTIIIFGVTGSGVFGRGIQYNLYENTTKF